MAKALSSEPMWLFGAGRFARDAAIALRSQGAEPLGFLSSGSPAQAVLDGLPCEQLSAAHLGARPIWVAVLNHQRVSDFGGLQAQFESLGNTDDVVWPQTWYASLKRELGWRFWLSPLEDYVSAEIAIREARSALDDTYSQERFDALLAFRRERHTCPPVPSPEEQYLPGWLRQYLKNMPLRLVDGGAFRGETVNTLAQLHPIDQAWLFEPDPANFAALRVDAAIPARCFQLGLSDVAAELHFSVDSGAASAVTDGGGALVHVQALDEVLSTESVNFIKLDVEGHERQALLGARATIQRCRPVLAICAYHRWDDLWRLPTLVRELLPEYRLRLDTHQHNSFDTVLYAFI